MTQNQKVVGGVGISLLLLIGAYSWIKYQGRLEERSRHSAVILKNTQDSLKVVGDSLLLTVNRLEKVRGKVDTIWIERVKFVASADSLHKIVDSLKILASSDSIAACKLTKEALAASESECLVLRKAIIADTVAIKLQRAAMDSASNVIYYAKQKIEALNKDLKEATKPYLMPLSSALRSKLR